MTESIFLIIGIAIGYALCWLSMKESARSLTLTIEMLQGAFNARFAPKAKAMSTVEVQQSVVGESSVVSDPTKPIKTVPEWNINALRQSALQKIAGQEKSINESLQRLP